MKLNIFPVVVIMLFANLLFAQQTSIQTKSSPEKQALVKEYFEATGGRDLVNKILDAATTSLDDTLTAQISGLIEQNYNLTVAQKAAVQKKTARIDRSYEQNIAGSFESAG